MTPEAFDALIAYIALHSNGKVEDWKEEWRRRDELREHLVTVEQPTHPERKQ